MCTWWRPRCHNVPCLHKEIPPLSHRMPGVYTRKHPRSFLHVDLFFTSIFCSTCVFFFFPFFFFLVLFPCTMATTAPLPTKSATLAAPITLPSHGPFQATLDATALDISNKILSVISRYALRSASSQVASKADEGQLKFLSIIYSQVKASQCVQLCLPAFPFKSPNSTRKVLGKLPDKAEEVALAHLNGLCLAVRDAYPPGAQLTIISDGLVYNGEF